MQAGQDKTMTVQGLSLPAIWETFRTRVIGRKFVQDVGVLTVANFFSAALGLAQGIVVARTLGPQLYGVAALVMSYPSLLFSFLDARSADASVKYLGEFDAKGEVMRALAICKLGYAVDLTVAALTFVLVATTAWWAEKHIVHTPGIGPLIILYAAAFLPRALAGTSRAVLMTLGRFPMLAWIRGLNAAIRTAVVVGLVLGGYGITGVIWGNALGLAAEGLIIGIIAYPMVKRTWGASWLSGSWSALRGKRREIFGFLFYNDLNALLGLFSKQFDLVILGYFRGPQEAGYYRLAKSIGAVVGNSVGPLQSVTYPRLVHFWGAEQQDELKLTIRRYALWMGVPLGALVFVSLPLVPPLINVVLGDQFRPTAFAAQLFLASSAIWLVFFWLRPAYLAAGRVRSWTIGIGIYAFCFVLIAFPAAKFSGYVGLAGTFLLVNGVFHLAMSLGALGMLRDGVSLH